LRYTRGLISFIVIAMVVALGILAFSTDQVKAQDCLLTIEKVATPANNVPFLFSVTGDITSEFTLMVPGNTTTDIGLFDGPGMSMITITEEPPAGWELESIECTLSPPGCDDGGPVPCLNVTIDEATNSITAECLDGDEGGSCTFFNSKDCSIEIVKVADPADDTPFEFEILPSGQNFTLMDPSQQSFTFFLNGNETVRVTELPTEGLLLTDINCTTEDEENALILLDQRAVRITCELPGSSFACTFVNRTTKIPTLSEWGLIAMAGLLGIVGFMVLRRRKVTA